MSDDTNFPTLEDMLSGKMQFPGDFDPHKSPAEWLQTAQQDAMKPHIELARDYAKVFGTEAGRRVLDHLIDQTHRKSSWLGGLHLPMETIAAYGVWREGQNAIVQIIVEHVRLGNAKQSKPRK